MPALAESPRDKSLAEQEVEIRRMEVAAARRSSAAFTSYVMRDEAGRPLKMAPFHRDWHLLLAHCEQLIIEGSAEIGKSVQLIAWCAWKIGIDPTIRIVIVSKNRDKAAQLLSALVKVMHSPQYREVFPERSVQGWNVHTLRVNGWDGRNPTVQAYQFKAPITGNRVDIVIFDDILDSMNTRTEDQRVEYFNFYKNTYISRLTYRGQVVFVSNSWHPRDLMHRLKAEPGWTYRRYPIWWPGADGGMVSLWPEQWPIARIEKVRSKFAEDQRYFQRVYECIAIDDSASVWEQSWIDAAEREGKGLRMVRSLVEAQGEFFRAITLGVDLATCRPASRRKTDESVFTVNGRRPDGKKRLLCIEHGRFHGPQLVDKIRDLYKRFGGIPWVETNGAQKYIYDFCTAPDPYGVVNPIPIRSFETTASNKYDPRFGVEALGTEMACGIQVFPHVPVGDPYHAAYQHLIKDMKSYDPGQHAGDFLMSHWIGNEGLRLGHGGATVVPGLHAAAR